MQFIKHLEGALAWVYNKGVYKQLPVYARGEKLYVKVGGGYVRLGAHQGTSIPTMSWRELDGGALFDLIDNGMRDPSYVDLSAVAETKAAPKKRTRKAPGPKQAMAA